MMLSLDQLQDPKEAKAYRLLSIAAVIGWLVLLLLVVGSAGMILVYVVLGVLLRMLGERWASAYIRSNAVRVSPAQLPDLHRTARSCCEKLGIAEPEVYVLQDGVWNAYAAKMAGRRMVVLLSGAVDSILLKGSPGQLAWLVAHEIGHIASGHLEIRKRWAHAGGWLPWLLLWYKRRGEVTCDRIGLYCAGNLRDSLLAVSNMTVGAQLADQVDLAEAIRQWEQCKDELFVKYRTLYSTHPHHLQRLAELTRSAQELGIPVLPAASA